MTVSFSNSMVATHGVEEEILRLGGLVPCVVLVLREKPPKYFEFSWWEEMRDGELLSGANFITQPHLYPLKILTSLVRNPRPLLSRFFIASGRFYKIAHLLNLKFSEMQASFITHAFFTTSLNHPLIACRFSKRKTPLRKQVEILFLHMAAWEPSWYKTMSY